MHHEISQLDIPDRQLLSNARPSIWTEIGDAQITHTIFGRAKVRIIRKNDNRYRVLWITGIIAAIALAAAAWQGFFTSQQAEQTRGTDQPPIEIKEPVSAPATHLEKSITPATPPEVTKELSAPVQAGNPKSPISASSAPQQAHLPMSPEPKLVHPETPLAKPNSVQPAPHFAQPRSVTSEPSQAIRPPGAPRSASSAVKSPTTAQPLNPSMSKPTGTVAPALSTKPVAQPAASGPASGIQLSDPVQKPLSAPAADSQPPALDNAQSK